MEITFDVFSGNKLTNELMHSADIFDSSKQLATYRKIKFIDDKKALTLDKWLVLFKEILEKADENVIFLSIREIDGQPNNEFQPYILENINSLSTGHKFGVFEDMLDRIGYDVESDERRRVKSAKLRT